MMKKEALHKKDEADSQKEAYLLVLINDDINTFNNVIKILVEVCGHDPCQAEQCAMITHFKGQCQIMHGTRNLLQAISKTLGVRGLKSEII
jgi:ATP-dependent Clp protease adaptor protein ClpS